MPIDISNFAKDQDDLGSRDVDTQTAVDPALSAYGADPTGIADSTVAFQMAYAAAAKSGHFMLRPSPGTYTVSGTLHAPAITTPFRMVCEPGTVTIQRGVPGSPATIVNSRIIDIEGSVNASVLLSANAAVGDLSVTVAALPTDINGNPVAAGATLEVTSNVIFSGNAITAEYVEVSSITGTGPFTINLQGTLEEAYATANAAAVAVVNWAGVGSYIRGVTFRQTAQSRDSPSFPLITLQRVRNFQIDGVTCRDADVPGLDLRNVVDGSVTDYYCENLTDQIPNFVGYGINLNNNCRNIIIDRPRGTQVRHVFTTNADAGFGCPRHWKVLNGVAWETHSGAWNTHRESKHGLFAHCESHHDIGGFFIRAPYTTLIEPLVVLPGYSSGAPGTGISISSDNGTFTATRSRVVGGRVILGPKSLHGWFTDCPGPHTVIGLSVEGPGFSGTNYFGQTNASGIELIDVRSESPVGAQHFIVSNAGTGHKISGGTFTGSAKPIASVATAGGLVIGGNVASDSTFNYEQNQRALVQVQPGNVFAASGAQSLRDLWHTVTVDATGAARVMTLPAASAAMKDRDYIIIKSDASANAVSVVSGGGTLFGTASTAVQGGIIRVRSDGTNWYCG